MFNYEQIANILELFFKNLGYKSLPITDLTTKKDFNYGVAYTIDKYEFSNTYIINRCSRIEDIIKAIDNNNENNCVLPIFHIFGSYLTLELLVIFLNYIIKSFNLDSSKIQLETTYDQEKVVNILNKECYINNINYINKNIAKILCDGSGYIIGPYGSNDKKIYQAISINYLLDKYNKIEIIQLVELEDNKFCIGIGIERIYTAINYIISNSWIPNWYNTLPLFKSTIDKEIQENGTEYPKAYNLILNTDPKDFPNKSVVYNLT
jgi:hypothetical protein